MLRSTTARAALSSKPLVAPSLSMARKIASSAPRRSEKDVVPPGYSVDSTVGPMLRFEKSLPGLPVPTISSTAAKYLETVKPHLTPTQYKQTTAVVEKFIKSPLVHTLQERLQARAAQNDSWLSEWWNEVAYMGYRDPVVVFVSYFYVFLDDAARKTQAERAAALVKATLAFREIVESQKLEPERVRDIPLAMSSYKWLFNSCRYPVKPSDTAQKFDPSTNSHVVFVRKNRFYEVPTEYNGTPLTTAELEAQVKKIIELAGNDKAVPVGALTSENRDVWADARKELVEHNPQNAKSLERIESAVIIVALDDIAPQTRKDASWACWVGDGRNRFYDKHQLIVFENGKAGFLGEHSCMDGTPTLRMTEFIMGALAANKIDHGNTQVRDIPAPTELKFVLDSKLQSTVAKAEEAFETLVGAHDMEVLHFDAYGKNQIKNYKASPDAWAQLVKQLAFHKMFGRPGVCYESAQTRKFKLGRTEVIRAASNESKEWAEAMLNPQETDEKRALLFRRAVARHLQYAAWAADGQGVDRHLFGLKRLIKEGEELPELYSDVAFSKTNHWELSTSNLSSKWLDGWGYGEVVPDGYGLSYSIGDDYIRWTITSLKRDTAKLKHYLEESAVELKAMLDRAGAATGAGAGAKPKL